MNSLAHSCKNCKKTRNENENVEKTKLNFF